MYRIGRPRLYTAVIITILLEIAFLNLVNIGSIRPNLMLIVVIFVGLHSDWKESLETGIAGGLLKGVMTTGSVGFNLVILGLSGLFASYCKNKVYKDNFLTQIVLTLLIATVVNSLAFITNVVAKNVEVVNINIWHTFLLNVMLLSFYTSLIAPPAFFCLKKLLRMRGMNL